MTQWCKAEGKGWQGEREGRGGGEGDVGKALAVSITLEANTFPLGHRGGMRGEGLTPKPS